MKIQLNKEEYDFLMDNSFLSDELKQSLKNIDVHYNLTIDENKADAIRDECGEYLQVVGFDKDYNPTKRGVILECLIDKFFIG